MVALLSEAICFACVVLPEPGVPHTMIAFGIVQKLQQVNGADFFNRGLNVVIYQVGHITAVPLLVKSVMCPDDLCRSNLTCFPRLSRLWDFH